MIAFYKTIIERKYCFIITELLVLCFFAVKLELLRKKKAPNISQMLTVACYVFALFFTKDLLELLTVTNFFINNHGKILKQWLGQV